jgi:hypothetical protein
LEVVGEVKRVELERLLDDESSAGAAKELGAVDMNDSCESGSSRLYSCATLVGWGLMLSREPVSDVGWLGFQVSRRLTHHVAGYLDSWKCIPSVQHRVAQASRPSEADAVVLLEMQEGQSGWAP